MCMGRGTLVMRSRVWSGEEGERLGKEGIRCVRRGAAVDSPLGVCIHGKRVCEQPLILLWVGGRVGVVAVVVVGGGGQSPQTLRGDFRRWEGLRVFFS